MQTRELLAPVLGWRKRGGNQRRATCHPDKREGVYVGVLEEYGEALVSFHPLAAQAILFIVVAISRPKSPPKRIFGVRQLHLPLEPGYHSDM
ncbi:hypothetical protein E2C01_096019 [Portunus trituberculatus]|uniref:Uncharacterized protein n=1 Tax=Portunus trituberculatus TaxID=210409 RepID=A0A5B7JRK0_PORTR|nr:hypothetical protein [Portunus trituberculatus]